MNYILRVLFVLFTYIALGSIVSETRSDLWDMGFRYTDELEAFVFLGMVVGIIGGIYATRKGLSFYLWYLLSYLTVGIALLAIKNKPYMEKAEPVKKEGEPKRRRINEDGSLAEFIPGNLLFVSLLLALYVAGLVVTGMNDNYHFWGFLVSMTAVLFLFTRVRLFWGIQLFVLAGWIWYLMVEHRYGDNYGWEFIPIALLLYWGYARQCPSCYSLGSGRRIGEDKYAYKTVAEYEVTEADGLFSKSKSTESHDQVHFYKAPRVCAFCRIAFESTHGKTPPQKDIRRPR